MKKLKKINLHNLSQAEMASSELYLLKGGSGSYKCACISICKDAICRCETFGYSGSFSTSVSCAESFSASSIIQESLATKTAASVHHYNN